MSSGILHRVALVTTDVLKENITSINRMIGFEVFTAVTMKNGVFWDVTPFGFCKNRRFGGTWRLLHQGDKDR
jgi:hypothetical protein